MAVVITTLASHFGSFSDIFVNGQEVRKRDEMRGFVAFSGQAKNAVIVFRDRPIRPLWHLSVNLCAMRRFTLWHAVLAISLRLSLSLTGTRGCLQERQEAL